MNFPDRISADPLGALAGCLVWIPIAVWVVSIIHWLVGGDIDGFPALVSLVVAIGLGMIAVNPPTPALSPLILAATATTVFLFPMVRSALNRHALAAIDMEQLDRAFQGLQQHPNSAGILVRVAELLYIRGLRANALAIGELAIKSLPKSSFQAEHAMVGTWRYRVGKNEQPKTHCTHCGFENQPTDIVCRRCHRPYLVDLARGRWLGKVSAEKLIVVWIVLMMAFVGVPAATHFAKTNPALALFAIMGQLVLGLLLVIVSFLRGSS